MVGYTAHCMQDEINQLLNCGFDRILIKPVSFAQMADAAGSPAGARLHSTPVFS
jgi:hypothetical protein